MILISHNKVKKKTLEYHFQMCAQIAQKCARKKRKKVSQIRAQIYSIFEITLLDFQNLLVSK